MSVIIRLKNLPMTAGAADVRTFFHGLKIPDGAVHIIGGDEGEVFVGFASDEDARVAMTRNGKYIHDAEIRLLLSSKSEQNAVIEARRNGTYVAQPAFSPVQESLPPPSQPAWAKPSSGNPYAARSNYESSYPPQQPHSDFQNQNSYNEVPPPDNFKRFQNEPPKEFNNFRNGPPPMNSPPRREQPPKEDYDDYSFKRNNFNQAPPPTSRFQGQGSQRAQDPSMSHLPPVIPQRATGPPQVSPKQNNYGGFRGGPPETNTNHQGAPNGGIQGGESWRDSSYPPQNAPQHQNDKDFGRGSKFNPQHGQSHSAPDAPTGRKTLMPTPKMNFPASNGPARVFQNGPPQGGAPVAHQPPNGLPPFQNRGPPPNMPQTNSRNHTPVFNNGPPPLSKLSVPILPPVPEKFYIELTRLPNDLLRPAALEAFIRPTVPLTLSSVKTVFGPGGIHMHTIIRLDSIADYATMMRRNGEQGIKIQQSDKKTFDTAEDGAPVPVFTAPAAPTASVAGAKSSTSSSSSKRDEESKSRRSRWGDKSPSKENSRRERRSISPIRKRRRSRSPKRREDHRDPTRWCIQITNVPFRVKDEELLEYFAEKVKPAKLSRTYYSDGNASDRWIAEFSSESLMRRAFAIRGLCQGRTLKMSYIDNEKADEILKIEDVYGKEKRMVNEEARMMQEEAEKANPPSFFNQPSVPRAPLNNQGPPLGNPPPSFNGPPGRGGFAPRGNGNGFQPQRGGMMGGPPRGGGPQPFYQNGPSAFNNGQNGPPPQGEFRGGFHGNSFRGGRGGGGGRGGFQGPGGFRDDQPPRNEFMELVQSIGPRGTVLTCNGFPRDITLEEVVDFFSDYEPDRNSVRIRRGDDGVMTGECMLACFHPDDAHQAARDLDGQNFRNSTISVKIL